MCHSRAGPCIEVGGWRARARRIALAVLGALLGAQPALALDPSKDFHHFVKDVWSIEDGLSQITVQALAQDDEGFLWVGTQAGLARFDGVRFTSWRPQTLPELPGIKVQALALDGAGRLWIGTYKGMAVRDAGGFAQVPAADAAAYPALDVSDIAVGADGRVLAATQDGLFEVRDGRLVAVAGVRGPVLSLLLREDAVWVGGRGGVHQVGGGTSTFLALPAAIANAVVTGLLEAHGQVWVGTSAGLWLHDGEHWRPAPGHLSLAQSPVEMLFADRDGNLWVGLADGLARLRAGQPVEFIAHSALGAHPSPLVALEDHEGNLWLGSRWEGLARIWNGWTRRYAAAEGLHEPVVWSLARDPDGRLWVGTNDGLSVFDGARFERVLDGAQLPHPHAYTLLAEPGAVWIGTRRGLAVLRGGTLEQPAAFAALAGTQVNGILRDRDGVLWLATLQGLFRYRDGRLDRFDEAAGLGDRRVRLLLETRERWLLVATQSGLYRFQGERLLPVGLDSGLPPGLDVTALQQLADGRLVLGTLSEQLFVYDGRRWRGYGAADGLPVNSPYYIAEDDYGMLWVAGIRGIGRVPAQDFAAYDAGSIPALRGEMLMNERGDRRAGQKGYCCNGAGNAKGLLDERGVLWLPSRGGVVSMDSAGITKNATLPQVHIERVRHSGNWHEAALVEGITLPPSVRDLGFDFTVLSFQDPLSARLRYRLVGYDQQWHELEDLARRRASYTNLPPGPYRFEVEGANNAGAWNPRPTALSFTLAPHLHETRWFLLVLAAAGLLLVYAAFRWQLRALHRQRAQLALQVRERTVELQQANRQLREASHTDVLTGLRNRRYLADQLPTDLAFYDRRGSATEDGQVLVFALVDIDHFRRVNDALGPTGGDAVLRQFAQLLAAQVRSGDYLVRWGGEEFLLVFRPMSNRELATLGERICGGVRVHAFDPGDGSTLRLTCSIGFAEYARWRDDSLHDGHGGSAWPQMVELAEQALHWVKQHGRDGWAAFRPTGRNDFAALVADLQRHGAATLLREQRLELLSSRA